jgi:hypothetical protein
MRGPLMRRLGLSIGKTWTEEPANQPRTVGRARVTFVEISNLVPTQSPRISRDSTQPFHLTSAQPAKEPLYVMPIDTEREETR